MDCLFPEDRYVYEPVRPAASISGFCGLLPGALVLFSFSAVIHGESLSTRHYNDSLLQQQRSIGIPSPRLLLTCVQRLPAGKESSPSVDYASIKPWPVDKSWEERIATVLGNIPSSKKAFVRLMIPAALQIQKDYGIPASATMGMAIYESGYGDSLLARAHNNYFGIKAFPDWKGESVEMKTRDEGIWTTANFRSYADFSSGVTGFAIFLSGSPRYAGAFSAKDGAEFVQHVWKAGYCPDSDYFANVAKIIGTYQLQALDKSPTLLAKAGGQAAQ